MTQRVEEVIAGLDEWYNKDYKRRQTECDQAHNRHVITKYTEDGDTITVFNGSHSTEQRIIRLTADIELCSKCFKKLDFSTEMNLTKK